MIIIISLNCIVIVTKQYIFSFFITYTSSQINLQMWGPVAQLSIIQAYRDSLLVERLSSPLGNGQLLARLLVDLPVSASNLKYFYNIFVFFIIVLNGCIIYIYIYNLKFNLILNFESLCCTFVMHFNS